MNLLNGHSLELPYYERECTVKMKAYVFIVTETIIYQNVREYLQSYAREVLNGIPINV
jgi:hypothetical protein